MASLWLYGCMARWREMLVLTLDCIIWQPVAWLICQEEWMAGLFACVTNRISCYSFCESTSFLWTTTHLFFSSRLLFLILEAICLWVKMHVNADRYKCEICPIGWKSSNVQSFAPSTCESGCMSHSSKQAAGVIFHAVSHTKRKTQTVG